MENVLIINVDELWLKGKNRPFYFKALKAHIKELMKRIHCSPTSIVNENQRFVARSEKDFGKDIIEALKKVPGIHSICSAEKVELDQDAIVAKAIEMLEQLDEMPKTFKVRTKRTNKSWPLNSMETSRMVGHLILKNYWDSDVKLSVDVKNPEVFIDIKVVQDCVYVSTANITGLGGLPWGTNGHLVTMLSGGFDSPVASYLMSRRGCKQTFVFFHAYPYVGDEVKEKIIQISSVLGSYQKNSKLYVVPFGPLQDKIAQDCKEEYRTLFFRRFMVECSNTIADKVHGHALLTGDALGQVSSQTISNISYLDSVIDKPIFRPLIGHNKIEIVNLSRKVGTHDISVIPHDDACSLFAPKHPIIRPDIAYLKEFEKEFDYTDEVTTAVNNSEIYSIRCTGEVILDSE